MLENNTIHLMINIIVNLFDWIMIYCVCYNLIEKRPQISIKTVSLGILLGIISGILAYNLDSYTYRIMVTFTIILILRLISRRNIRDLPILFVVTYLCVLFIQFPVILISGFLNLNQGYRLLFSQTLSIIIVVYLSLKVPLYKLFNTIEKEILLKLFIFVIMGIFLIVFSYFNFEYTNAREYVLYFFILIMVAFVGLYGTIKRVYFYTNKVPMQLHDVKNILMGMYISVHSTSDSNVIRQEIDKSLAILGMGSDIEDVNIGKYNENILSFINQKKCKSNKNLKFLTEVEHYEPNAKMPLSVILYILGVLIDNTIESNTSKPILIKISVVKEGVLISVANEYKKKFEDDFENMFKQGYSTKQKYGRGYGLPNLIKVIKSYGGEIKLDYDYKNEYDCDYLTIIIDIKN